MRLFRGGKPLNTAAMLITSGQPYKSKNKSLEFLCAGRLRVSNNIPVCQSQKFHG